MPCYIYKRTLDTSMISGLPCLLFSGVCTLYMYQSALLRARSLSCYNIKHSRRDLVHIIYYSVFCLSTFINLDNTLLVTQWHKRTLEHGKTCFCFVISSVTVTGPVTHRRFCVCVWSLSQEGQSIHVLSGPEKLDQAVEQRGESSWVDMG